MKKHTISISLFLLGIFSSILGFSQKNNVKIGLGGLLYQKINLNYERVLTKKTSLQLHAGFLVPISMPTSLLEGLGNGTAGSSGEIKGNSLALEYRIYSGKKDVPRGFYFAPYARYSNMSMNFNTNFDYDNSGTTINLPISATGGVRTIAGGFQLGVQWLIKSRVSIDWSIFGLGVASHKISIDMTHGSDVADFTQISGDIEQDFKDIPVVGSRVGVTSSKNNFNVTAPFLMLDVRSGLSLGVAF